MRKRILSIVSACVLSTLVIPIHNHTDAQSSYKSTTSSFTVPSTPSTSSSTTTPTTSENSVAIISVTSSNAGVYSSNDNTLTKVATLTKGEQFPILSSTVSAYKIQLLDRKTGYIAKSKVQVKNIPRIVMGWNYGADTNTYIQQNNVTANLNVVSPRWFTLTYGKTPLSVNTDTHDVEASHANGKKVWPLIGNRFDSALTNSVLRNATKRHKVIRTIKNTLVQTKADGINVDFENIDMKNKRDFVTFVQELHAALQPVGKTVSVDVSRTNPDPNWSGSFDRRGLGQAADYVMIMGYDEHWDGDTTPGSTASLSWTDEGIKLLMNDVPAHKIVLGVPFYTQEWVTNLATGKVTNTERSMPEVQQIIANHHLTKKWNATTSQDYVEFTKNGQKHQIWIEDKKSMAERRNLVNQYHLGGVAAWFMGDETHDVWSVFDGYKK